MAKHNLIPEDQHKYIEIMKNAQAGGKVSAFWDAIAKHLRSMNEDSPFGPGLLLTKTNRERVDVLAKPFRVRALLIQLNKIIAAEVDIA